MFVSHVITGPQGCQQEKWQWSPVYGGGGEPQEAVGDFESPLLQCTHTLY